MNFDFDEITGIIVRIVLILIGIAVALGAFGLAGIVIRYAMGVWA